MTPVAVVTTVGSADEARRMARALVEGRLAACVQMTPIDSVYAWDGAVREGTEVRLIAKTTAERYDAVEAAILALHPYDLPAIHSVALDRVHAAYGEWIAAWVAVDGAGPVEAVAEPAERGEAVVGVGNGAAAVLRDAVSAPAGPAGRRPPAARTDGDRAPG